MDSDTPLPPPTPPSPSPDDPRSGTPPQNSGDVVTCEHAQRQMERMLIDSDLREAERHLLQMHLRQCESCRKVYENLRRLEAGLKQNLARVDTAPRFTERVMAVLPATSVGVSSAHKQRVAVNKESAVFVTGSYIRSNTPPSSPVVEARPVLRRYGWVLAGTPVLLALVVLAYLYAGYARLRGEHAPPRIVGVSGHVLLVSSGGSEEKVATGVFLNPKEFLQSQDKPVDLKLDSEDKFIARIVLAPRTKVRAQNRHSFQVLEGAAYFQVAKDRPGIGEIFSVDADTQARVEVTGTAFSVDLTTASLSNSTFTKGALIVVEEGSVKVSSERVSQMVVKAGEEVDVGNAHASPRKSNIASRLAWMRPREAAAASAQAAAMQQNLSVTPAAPENATDPARITEPTETVQVAAPLDWNAVVADLPVAGLSFENAWSHLEQRVGDSRALQDLYRQFARHMDVNAMRVRFSVHAPLSLKSFVSWLARDAGCRFELTTEGEARVRRAEADEAPGLNADGVLPAGVRTNLRNALEDTFALRDAATLEEFLDRLGRRSRLTLVATDPTLYTAFGSGPRGQASFNNGGSWLRWAERLCGARAVWYDGLVYFAPADKAEELTRIQRAADVDITVSGPKLEPRCAKALLDLVENLRYDSQQTLSSKLVGRAALEGAALVPALDGRGLQLRYTTGVIGDEIVREALSQLKSGTARATDVARLYSQPLPPGPIRDMDELIEAARKKQVAAEARVRVAPFVSRAFVAKNMEFGEAFEWAAWLGGAGIRQENGLLLVDDARRCYGLPRPRVLVLEGIAADLRAAAAARVAALATEIYPTFFKDVRLYALHGRLAFSGDQRQVLLVQRLALALEKDLAGGNVPSLETWLPPTRTKLLERLNERVQAGGRLSGPFAGMLRQSALASQLTATALVDPLAMKDAASAPVDVDTTQRKILDVLNELARQAGLRVVLEGDVVWFQR